MFNLSVTWMLKYRGLISFLLVVQEYSIKVLHSCCMVSDFVKLMHLDGGFQMIAKSG